MTTVKESRTVTGFFLKYFVIGNSILSLSLYELPIICCGAIFEKPFGGKSN